MMLRVLGKHLYDFWIPVKSTVNKYFFKSENATKKFPESIKEKVIWMKTHLKTQRAEATASLLSSSFTADFRSASLAGSLSSSAAGNFSKKTMGPLLTLGRLLGGCSGSGCCSTREKPRRRSASAKAALWGWNLEAVGSLPKEKQVLSPIILKSSVAEPYYFSSALTLDIFFGSGSTHKS